MRACFQPTYIRGEGALFLISTQGISAPATLLILQMKQKQLHLPWYYLLLAQRAKGPQPQVGHRLPQPGIKSTSVYRSH